MRRDGLTKVIRLNLDKRSYATFSTKPKDRVRRSKLIAKYGNRQGRFAPGGKTDVHQPHQMSRSTYRCVDGLGDS